MFLNQLCGHVYMHVGAAAEEVTVSEVSTFSYQWYNQNTHMHAFTCITSEFTDIETTQFKNTGIAHIHRQSQQQSLLNLPNTALHV